MLSFLPPLALLASIVLFPPLSQAATENPLCNGHATLCSRKYSNITFLGAHDSPFVGDSPADNQGLSVTDQLNAGIRFLQGQTHVNAFKALSLCHTNCFLNDAGNLTSYLSTIKEWLDAHPDEVLTLLLTNGDRLDPGKFDAAFKAAGVDKYAFVPPNAPLPFSEWPTLGDLIENKTRLVVFLDYGAKPSSVPYILDQFAYYFETPFNTVDPAFDQCSIDRPPKASPDGRMYVVNHYLDKQLLEGLLGDDVLVPDREAAGTTNGKESVGKQVGLCEGLYGRRPNVVLLDFVEEGVEGLQRELNGL
ncbi:MAG: hypothetical protein LQ346_007924 [Caloplaca aetnensis]|nr:MAG: hypothetical protein LQ346_007924 [Caloplaca aetnensis]